MKDWAFLNIREHELRDPDFVQKRKTALNINQELYVCKDCLLGTHMYCYKLNCHCCYARTGDLFGQDDTQQA